MKTKFLKIGTIFIFYILISGTQINGQGPDTTKIGVNNNDEFTFVVDSYIPFALFGETAYSPGYDMESYNNLEVQVGDEFTMKIVNNTLQDDYWFGESNDIIVEFSNSTDKITSKYDLMDNSDNLVTFTDWAFWESNYTAEAKKLSSENSDITWSVNNGDKEFEYKFSGTMTQDGATFTGDLQIIYEKSSGVILYSKTIMQVKGEGITIDINNVIRRVGFKVPGDSDSGSLPGFEFLAIGFALVLIPVIRLKTKKINRN